MSTNTWQSQVERGSALWIGLLIWIVRRIGRRATHLLLWPIALYFLCTGAAARRASRDYLIRVLDREPRLTDIVRIFRNFACCTLDRFLILSGQGRGLNLRMQLVPAVEIATRGKGGCIVLVSHLGSFEVLRQMSAAGGHAPLRVLLDRAHGPVLTSLLEQLNPEFATSIIDAMTPGPQLVLALREALESGCNVGIMADRVRGKEASVEVSFLGGAARFPAAPWTLALLLGVPVVAAFALYLGGATYELRFELLSDRIEGRRDERREVAHRWAQRYAEALERQAREAPYNWFNFFPFWIDEAPRN